MQKLNLLTAALSGGALALLLIGAVENVFNTAEIIAGTAVCLLAFILSITWEG
jgi:ABC-type uncharacterized transport system permease subunit